MTRKPPLATEDDQTRRFAVQFDQLAPDRDTELLMALTLLRHACGRFANSAEVITLIEGLEAAIRRDLMR